MMMIKLRHWVLAGLWMIGPDGCCAFEYGFTGFFYGPDLGDISAACWSFDESLDRFAFYNHILEM